MPLPSKLNPTFVRDDIIECVPDRNRRYGITVLTSRQYTFTDDDVDDAKFVRYTDVSSRMSTTNFAYFETQTG